jgi:hypothetical protein
MAPYQPRGPAGRDPGSQETSTRRNSRDDYESARNRASTTQPHSGGQQSYNRMEEGRGAQFAPPSPYHPESAGYPTSTAPPRSGGHPSFNQPYNDRGARRPSSSPYHRELAANQTPTGPRAQDSIRSIAMTAALVRLSVALDVFVRIRDWQTIPTSFHLPRG